MNLSKKYHRFSQRMLLLLGICFPGLVLANSHDPNIGDQTSIFDLMHYQEVLELTLETDVETLKAERLSDEYQKANIFFKDQFGKEQSWNMKVKLRGAYRRIHCSELPPLKWKFKKDDLKEAGLADFNDLKMVPFCISEIDEAEQVLKKEYLAYKLYNALTPISFRVQLLKITYRDVGTQEEMEQWAFLIEDLAQLRSRFNAENCENCFGRTAVDFHQEDLDRVAVFQYMIGNSDWSLTTAKNIKLLIINDKLTPVPYDFDFAGMVNAPYALPNPNYGLRKITDRAYIGFTAPNELKPTLKFYKEKKSELDQIVKDMKILSKKSRSEIRSYLFSFYSKMKEIKITEELPARKYEVSQEK